jgi:hypothetical protein
LGGSEEARTKEEEEEEEEEEDEDEDENEDEEGASTPRILEIRDALLPDKVSLLW